MRWDGKEGFNLGIRTGSGLWTARVEGKRVRQSS